MGIKVEEAGEAEGTQVHTGAATPPEKPNTSSQLTARSSYLVSEPLQSTTSKPAAVVWESLTLI